MVEDGDKADDLVFFNLVKKMGSEVLDFMKLTADCPSLNDGGYVQILDLQCKVEGGKYCISFMQRIWPPHTPFWPGVPIVRGAEEAPSYRRWSGDFLTPISMSLKKR